MNNHGPSKTEYPAAAGIYVHVPYCIRKCRYCDFVSFENAPEDSYFAMLAEQISSVKTERVDTVFFGGGTPSLASREQLGMVMDAIRKSFGLSADLEITIEVNPETVTAEKAAELRELGFNRVSMGVQSFDDRVLKALGRVHSAERARQAFRTLRAAGFGNINLDLMLGVPMVSDDPGRKPAGQSFASWESTLKEALALRPEHISFYSLQIEEGTPLYKDYAAGRADIPSWEENRKMYHLAVELLKDNGYHHYEVSNAALPGCECRHNLKYWTMQPYLGFGVSAHSFLPAFDDNGRLEWAYRGEADWSGSGSTCSGESGSKGKAVFGGIGGLEKEAPEDLKGDFIFTQLRLTEGLDTKLYEQLFGTAFEEEFAAALKALTAEGYLEKAPGRIRFTPKGLDHTNPVMEKLLERL